MTGGRGQQPTAEMRDERIGECHRQQSFSRAFGRGKCGQLGRFIAEPLCPKNMDERIDVHLEEACSGIPSALPCSTVVIHILDAGIGIMFYQICK